MSRFREWAAFICASAPLGGSVTLTDDEWLDLCCVFHEDPNQRLKDAPMVCGRSIVVEPPRHNLHRRRP